MLVPRASCLQADAILEKLLAVHNVRLGQLHLNL